MGLLEDVGELLDGRLMITVIAIAIGRLHEQNIGFLKWGRAMHERGAGIAKIAGEYEAAFLAEVFDIGLHDGRAKNVSGIEQGHAYPR